MIGIRTKIEPITIPPGFYEPGFGESPQFLLHRAQRQPRLPDNLSQMQLGLTEPKKQAENLRLDP